MGLSLRPSVNKFRVLVVVGVCLIGLVVYATFEIGAGIGFYQGFRFSEEQAIGKHNLTLMGRTYEKDCK